jgi:hypothetical protein
MLTKKSSDDHLTPQIWTIIQANPEGKLQTTHKNKDIFQSLAQIMQQSSSVVTDIQCAHYQGLQV